MAQIPALIISVAAGLVVSRVGDEGDVGGQVIQQVFANPQVLILTASILGILGLIPGMPNLVFLLLASLFAFGAWRKIKSRVAAAGEPPARAPETPAAASSEAQEASWSDVTPVDVLGLEVGYRLIPMVDKGQDGELLKRIRGLRKKFAQEVGFLTASVHIRDNLELKPNAYRITLKGVEIGSGEAHRGNSWRSIRARRRTAARARDPRPGLRPAGLLDRRRPARAGPRTGLHGGRFEHRGGHPPQPAHPRPRRRTAGPPGDPVAARPHRP